VKEAKFQLPEAERNLLVEQYQPYVRKIAHKIFRRLPARFDYEELVAFGNLGLVEAAERYDPQRGISFTTFSYYRIRGAIYDGLRQMGYQSVRVSAGGSAPEAVARWEVAANDLLQAAADDETADAPVNNVEDEVESVGRMIENLIPAYLLSLEGEFADTLPSKDISPAENLETQDSIRFVLKIMGDLSDQERELLEAVYFKQQSLTQIAAEKGITKSWVSRLHSRAIQRIRDRLVEIGFLAPE
jgi:RNA polymerase sigma factor FliA